MKAQVTPVIVGVGVGTSGGGGGGHARHLRQPHPPRPPRRRLEESELIKAAFWGGEWMGVAVDDTGFLRGWRQGLPPKRHPENAHPPSVQYRKQLRSRHFQGW